MRLVATGLLLAAGAALAWSCVEPPAPPIVIPPPAHVDIDAGFRGDLDAMTDANLADQLLIVQFQVSDFAQDPLPLADELARSLEDGVVERALSHVPYAAVHVYNQRGLQQLLRSPVVAGVWPNEKRELSLAESLPLIRQPEAAAQGFTGRGTAVAILDTGLDWRRAAFGTCTAVGSPGCRVVAALDTATEDNALDANGHGTNVSGIVAGVAPDASLIGIDVFEPNGAFDFDIIEGINFVLANRATFNIVAMNLSLGGGASTVQCPNTSYTAAFASARNAGVLPVVASGNDAFSNQISSPACVPGAVSVGAVYDLTQTSMAFGKCTDSNVTPDRITCFSNSANFLTLLAPGSAILAAGINMSGTSQATPHVAGAVAVLASAFPADSPDVRVARLTGSGRLITDPRNGVTTPRIDVAAALATAPCMANVTVTPSSVAADGGTGTASIATAAGCAWSVSSDAPWLTLTSTSGTGPANIGFTAAPSTGVARTAKLTTSTNATATITQTADTTGPTGTVTITGVNNPTNKLAVTLALTASDLSGVTQMCASNGTSCASTAFVAFAPTMAFTLAPVNNSATVRVWFKDGRGNVSATPASATIAVDVTPPVDGTVIKTVGDGRIQLNWSGFSDAGSAVASYILVTGATTATGTATTPANCTTGTVLQSGSLATAFVHLGLTNGAAIGYRVCAVDGAGNISAGATVTGTPVPEQVPPTGTISVVGGNGPLKTSLVPVTLSATDASRVTSMCLSSATVCTAFVAFSPTGTVAVPAGSGVRTVNAWFRDEWGNTMVTPATASTTIDVGLPSNGTATATPGNASVTLNWTGFADAESGLASFKVASAPTSAPANCTTGIDVGNGATTTLTGLANGTVLGIRICAVDRAGNLSTGVVVTAKPVPEFDPPVGSVSIVGAPGPLKSAVVTVNLAATDASRVTQMCLTTGATCTTFGAFAPTSSFTLASGAGVRTVNAFFRDEWGNTSTTPATASAQIDPNLPTNGTVAAVPDNGFVALAWSGFTDPDSGIDSFRVAYALTTPPPNCATGTIVNPGNVTGTIISGLVNGSLYGFRVCAVDKAGNVSLGTTTTSKPILEKDAPVGTVAIVGAPGPLNTSTVTLNLTATDASRVTQMCLSTTTACTTFVAFAATTTFTLAAGTGPRAVNAFFRDEWGNTSITPATATTDVDVTLPVNGSATGVVGNGFVTLNWTGFSDANSGLVGHRIAYAATTAPANCTLGTLDNPGLVNTRTISNLVNGTTYGFRICGIDRAGNLSTGVVVTAKPVLEFDPPTGTVAITGAPGPLKSSNVQLTIIPTDASRVTQMCLSTTTTCTAFVTFASPTTFALAAGSGSRSVNVWLRDEWGNTMTTPASASTLIDVVLPVNGTATASAGDAKIDLTWAGFLDADSGVVSYKVASAAATAPTNCATGLDVGNVNAFTLSGLANGTVLGVRICAVDLAGNLSTGVVVSAKPVPELNAPTGTVSVVGAPGPLKSSTVQLAITPVDASRVTQMCLSTATTCTAFTAFASPASFVMAAGSGSRTANVWLRDEWGNTMTTPISASVTIDVGLPSNGTATAAAGNGTVALAWTGFADAESGLAGYKVASAATTAPANCAAGADVGLVNAFTLTGLANGTVLGVRICAVDRAGNLSTGVVVSAKPVPELDPPVGNVGIVGAPGPLKSSTVTLTLSATDASAVSQMCISTTTTCTAFVTFAPTTTFGLAAGTGLRSVNVWFRDQWGNTTTTPATASTMVDVTLPINGTASAAVSDGTINLAWQGFSDVDSGIDSYRVAYATTTAPATCAAGTVENVGLATTRTLSGLVNGTVYGVRICAVDRAGNFSAGVALAAKPIPETNAPTGTVSIVGAPGPLKSSIVTLNISAVDDSGSTGMTMCMSTTTLCTNYVALAATTTFTMLSGSGNRTVNVFFRDRWGNTSTIPAQATAFIDVGLPLSGIVSATAGIGTIALQWTGFFDVETAVVGYRIAYQLTTTPASCSTGTVVDPGNVGAYTITGLTPSAVYGVRVCGVDVAGNIGTGIGGTLRVGP